MAMVKRFDFGAGTARFVLVGEDDYDQHHHIISCQCDELVEIDECFPTALKKKIAQQNAFTRITHKLEFFGACLECQ